MVQAVEAALRFWLERGVDGFRLDVFNCYLKDAGFRSNPRSWHPAGLLYAYIGQRHERDRDQPELREALAMMRRVMDEQPDRMLVGETLDEDPEYRRAASYVGPDRLHLAFNFQLLRSRWSAPAFHRAITAWTLALGSGGWPTWVLSNHDFPRHASRWGGRHADDRCKLAAMVAICLRGTPFLYYGEEIGMREARLPFRRLRDPVGRRFYPFHRGRDGCRTPMQWDGGPGAGFTRGTPWLPVQAEAATRNLAVQRGDPSSIFRVYRCLIALRKRLCVLQGGAMELPEQAHFQVLSWRRSLGGDSLLAVLNMSDRALAWPLPEGDERRLIFGTLLDRRGALPSVSGRLHLRPREGLLLGNEAVMAQVEG